jgi:hypothetical protein
MERVHNKLIDTYRIVKYFANIPGPLGLDPFYDTVVRVHLFLHIQGSKLTHYLQSDRDHCGA